MDEAPESFPYRCLPLAIANAHGWEILSPCGFEVEWNGGQNVNDVSVRPDEGTKPDEAPVALFGQGTFTIHIQGLFRTEPGWNLYVSGPPNSFKDGASPLTGIIETDWAPYTFTMNWKLTRPQHIVRFEENEVIAHIFPVERNTVMAVHPEFVSIDMVPELKAQFEAWSASRNAFQEAVRANPPSRPADKWQKLYYRGLTPDGKCPVSDHHSKLQVKSFANPDLAGRAAVAMTQAKIAGSAPGQETVNSAPVRSARALAKLEWILETQERQRSLSSEASGIFRVEEISEETFLDEFFAPGRPVILGGLVRDWPAHKLWSPHYLREKLGDATVAFQGGRNDAATFERHKDSHTRQIGFAAYMDMIARDLGNDAYITAYNSAANEAALAPLKDDLGRLDELLTHEPDRAEAMLWIGPKGTFTPLHHDLTNNLLVQITGSKRVILASPAETPKLYNDIHVFSEISDLTSPGNDLARYPRLCEVRLHDLILEAGDALFIPIGWWHQITALAFSISATYTNFKWPNEGWKEHP
ncbi:MAG: cupin-like domain-containing protein [Alphaproteobacteria bacterium]|nr:cupin-like domain-containing protein [Alphaproteobacteria bacterium]